MDSYATWDDVTLVAPIPLPDTLRARVEEYLAQASARLRALVPGLATQITNETVEPILVKGVVIDAVLRLLYNPIGAQSQTAGPYNMSKAGGLASDNITFDEPQITALFGPGEMVPGTFGISVAVRPGLPQVKTLPGMPFPAPVGLSAALDAVGGMPYTPEAIREWWAAAGSTPWWY